MKKYNWGIIGNSTITPKFIESMNVVDDGRIIHIGSRYEQGLSEIVKKYSIPNKGSYKSVIENPDVDIIYVNNTNDVHEETVLKSLDAGKHVLCEKPMAMSYEGTKKLIDVSQSNNCFLMEGLWTRFLPIYRVLDAVRDEFLGDVKRIEANFGFKGEWGPGRRLLNKELIGGTLMDNGIYPIWFAHHIFGESPIKIESSAKIGITGVDETTKYKLYFPQGKIASLESSIVTETPQSAKIYGAKGTMEIPLFWKADKLIHTFSGASNTTTIETTPYDVGFEYEINEVHRCVSNELLESKLFSHQNSLDISSTMDQIKKQIYEK